MPLQKTRLLREKGKFDEAIQLLEEYLSSLNVNQTNERIMCLNEQSNCLRRQGKLLEAEICSQEALMISKKDNSNLKGQGDSLFSLGSIYLSKGAFDRAETFLQESFSLREQIGNKTDIVDSLNNLSAVYWYKGDFNQTEILLKKCLVLCEEIGNYQFIAKILNNLGEVNRQKGDLLNAEDFYKRSLSVNEEIENPQDISANLNNLGLVYWLQGLLNKAEEFHKRSLALRKEIGNPQEIALSLHNLGVIYWNRGDFIEAKDYIKNSLALWEQIGNQEDIAMALNSLGFISWHQGSNDISLNFLKQSLQIREKSGIPEEVADTLFMYSRVLLSQDGSQDITEQAGKLETLAQNSKSLKINIKLAMVNGLVDLNNQNMDKALEFYLQAKKQSTDISHFELQVQSSLFLVDVYLQLYLETKKIEYRTKIENLLKELENITKNNSLHGIYVKNSIALGFFNQALSNLVEARRYFELAELLADECGLRTLTDKARKMLQNLNSKEEELQKQKLSDPETYENNQFKKMLAFIKEQQRFHGFVDF